MSNVIRPSQVLLFQGSNPDIRGLLCIVNREEYHLFTIPVETAVSLYDWLYKGGYSEHTLTINDDTQVHLVNSAVQRLWWQSTELNAMRDKRRLGTSGSRQVDPMAMQIGYSGGPVHMGTVRPDLD